jgi:hypothetical protein
LNEAKDTGDRATSNLKAEKTLAGVAVSVRRRWLKGKAQVRLPVANWRDGQAGGAAHGAAPRFERSASPSGEGWKQNGSRKGEGSVFADGTGSRVDSDFDAADQPD